MADLNMHLTFWGGAGEVGGNKLLLEVRGSRLMFDFGQSFSAGEDFFIKHLQPRQAAGLLDYLEFDMVPRIPGLYNPELLRLTELERIDPDFQGVFISHAHMDHAGYIGFLHPAIPLLMGETTKKILEAWEMAGRSIRLGEHQVEREFRTGDKICCAGGIIVHPFHVDHSIPGAYGFIVETPPGTLVYSGDLRFHGPASHLSREFIAQAAQAKPLALCLEGTRIQGESTSSEEEVLGRSIQIAQECPALVVVGQYPRDYDRLRTFWQVSRETDRKLAIPLKTACLLDVLSDDPKLNVSQIWEDREGVFVHFPRMREGLYCHADYDSWCRPYMPRMIKAEEIGRRQEEFIWILDFNHFNELTESRPRPGSVFIHSMSEAFSEDPLDMLEDQILNNWCEHFGLKRLQVHASGHASREELIGVIRELKPRFLIPMHTNHPELFRGLHPQVIIPEKGKPVSLVC